MTADKDNLTNENPEKNQPTENPLTSKEDAMSILEKRLAEINARKSGESAAPAAPQAPESAAKPAPAPAPRIEQEEKPAEPARPETPKPEPAAPDKPQADAATIAGGAVAAHEVIPPAENPISPINQAPERGPEAAAIRQEPTQAANMESEVREDRVEPEVTNPEAPVAPVQPVAFSEGLNQETTVAGAEIPEADKPENAETSFSTEKPTVSEPENTTLENRPAETPDAEIPNPKPTDHISTFDTSAAGSGTVTEAERDAAMGDQNSVGNIISGAVAMHEIIPEVMPGQRAEEEKTEPSTPAASAPVTTPAATEVRSEATGTDDTEDENGEEESISDTDYAAMSAPELERQLAVALKSPDSRKNYRQINTMYREYEQKLAAEKTEALEKFEADGNSADDFEYRLSEERQNLEKAMQTFRENRTRDYRSEEEQKQKNLQRKQALIAELRALVEAAETKSSADKMKALQEEWKAIGPVPQNESQELWNNYHALLDIFYNNRSIYFELKELDRKRNLDAKLQLIERAEALTDNPSINNSLQELRHLHEEWKNIGPVPNDQRDPIWERFIKASEKVHERKKEFLAGRREQEQENLVKKNAVLERLDPFQNFQTDRINDWRDKTEEIQAIKAEWDAIGLVPKENADQVNKRFWGVYKNFFHQKNQFFKSLDDQKMQNLKLKTELCEQAEAIKDSTDWDATKEKLIQLQKKWKTIGRVPDKYSDKVWERFRAACNEFFDRRQAEAQNKEAELDKLSSEKTAYLDELTEQLAHHAHPQAGSVAHLNEMVDKWKSFDQDSGRVNARAEEKFYALMEGYLDTIPELSNEAKNGILFKLQLDKLKGGPDASNKLYQKEQSIRKEISQLENDIRTLKTNIEFFARSKNAEKLREEYDARISEANKRIEMLQKQLREMRG